MSGKVPFSKRLSNAVRQHLQEQRNAPDFTAKTQPQDFSDEDFNSWEEIPFSITMENKWERHLYDRWVSKSEWEEFIFPNQLRGLYNDLCFRHDLFSDGIKETIRDVKFLDHMIQKKAREIEVISLGTESDEMPTEITFSALQEDGVYSEDWSFKDQSEYESYREFVQSRVFEIQGEIAEAVEKRAALVEQQRRSTQRYMEYYEAVVKEISDNDLWEKLGKILSVPTWNNKLQDMIGLMQRNDLIEQLD